MACTGIEFCKLAIGETKGRARWLAEELDERLPGFDEEIRIHVNGCPNSCARFQVADIGLMSALAPRPDGTKSDAFLVHLGGGMGDGESFGRKVKGVRIFAEDAADYVETLRAAVPRTTRTGGTELHGVRPRRWTTTSSRGSRIRRRADELRDAARRALLLPVLRRAGSPSGRPGRLAMRVCERTFELQLTSVGGDA